MGNYEVTDVDPADCESLNFSWGITFAEDGTDGTIRLVCGLETGHTDEDGTLITQSNHTVGSW